MWCGGLVPVPGRCGENAREVESCPATPPQGQARGPRRSTPHPPVPTDGGFLLPYLFGSLLHLLQVRPQMSCDKFLDKPGERFIAIFYMMACDIQVAILQRV